MGHVLFPHVSDIDECISSGGDVCGGSARCYNIEGSFLCTCDVENIYYCENDNTDSCDCIGEQQYLQFKKKQLDLTEKLRYLSYCSDPIPLVGGRTIYSNGLFLGDRYIHHREMRVVSLKSSSSVEFEINKIFLNFVFSRIYRGLKFCVNT